MLDLNGDYIFIIFLFLIILLLHVLLLVFVMGTNLLDALHLLRTASMYLFDCYISDTDFTHCLPVLLCTVELSLLKGELLLVQFCSSKQLLGSM